MHQSVYPERMLRLGFSVCLGRGLLGALAAALCLWGVSSPALAYRLTAADEAGLRRGEVIVHALESEGRASHIVAAVDVAAPVDALWRLVTDCQESLKYVPGLEECDVLERAADGSWDVRQQSLRTFPFLPRMNVQFRMAYTPEHEIRYAQTEGSFDQLDGVWRLTPLADGRGTRVYYEANVAMGGLVPRSMIRGSLVSNAREVLEGVRREALR